MQAGRHYTNPGGIRLGVAELTRLGMGKGEMVEVAELVRLAMTGEKKREMTQRIAEMRKRFQRVKYSFADSPACFFR